MSNKISEQEMLEFRANVQGVIPIRHTNKVPQTPKRPCVTKKINGRRKQQASFPEQYFEPEPGYMPATLVSAEEILSFSRTGLQTRTLSKLKQGLFHIATELDLHGFTVTQAFQAFKSFIEYCQSNHYRCVRIIHGKGQRQTTGAPILKNKINCWLREMPEVLAFHSAKRNDGGAGAMYVLLKIRD